MFIDEWLTAVCEIDFKGNSMDSCTQLINYCQQNKIAYKATIENTAEGVKYTLKATSTNEAAYTMIRDYKNRGGN